MYSIPLPATDDDEQYRHTTARRNSPHRELMAQIAQAVSGAYAAYIAARGRSAAMTPIPASVAEARALRTAYDLVRADTGDDSLFSTLMKRTRGGQCPMCGCTPAGTLDHYLPRAVFPEFAILAKNLVPACWDCNHRKGEQVAQSDTRRYFHPYFDVLGAVPVLVADLRVDRVVTVDYHITQQPGVDQAITEVLGFHFDQLGLRDAFRAAATNELQDRYEALELYLGPNKDADAVRAYLEREARSCRASRGANDWKTALFTATAEHDDFCSGGLLLLR